MGRAVSVTQLYSKKRNILKFKDAWKRFIGEPELTGSWLVWGPSGNGKTSFMAQLAKYLTNFARVAYNSLEEGDSETMRKAFKRAGMEDVKGKIILLDREPITEMKERLRKHKAPRIVIIDSFQVSRMKYMDYLDLVEEFPQVLFLITSKAIGKEPKGNAAIDVKYDSSVKIYVEGYKAFPMSRYGGGEPFIIWEEGAQKYHGDF